MAKTRRTIKKPVKSQHVEIVVSQKQPMMIDDFTRAEGNDKSLVVTKLTANQIMHIIASTPREYIRKRKGKGNQEWYFVQGRYIKKKLNYVFGWAWDFQIVDKGQIGDFIWVQGRLTIKDPKSLQVILIKEQFGGSEIKKLKAGGYMDIGNDYKAAATDALKKCASELGIASDVAEMNEHLQSGGKIIESKTVDPVQQKIDYVKMLRDIGKKNDAFHDDDLVAYIKQITGIIVKDMKTLDQEMAKVIYAKMIQKGANS